MKNEIIKGLFGLVFFSVVIFFIYDLFRIELSRPKPKLSNTMKIGIALVVGTFFVILVAKFTKNN